MTEQQDILTTTEAARLLGLRQATIRQHIKAGRIEAKRWGRDWQVSRQSVEAWAQAHEGQEKRGRKMITWDVPKDWLGSPEFEASCWVRMKEEGNPMMPMKSREGYYDPEPHMDTERLQTVTEHVNAARGLQGLLPLSQDQVLAICLAQWDRPDPDLFRRWLTESPVEEIAEWVLSDGR